MSMKLRPPRPQARTMQMKLLSPADCASIMARGTIPVPARQLFAFLLYTQLRLREALALLWTHVHLADRSLSVTTPVLRRVRRVPIDDALAPLVANLFASRDLADVHVFPSGERLNKRLRTAGISAHAARHAGMALLLAGGESWHSVEERCGLHVANTAPVGIHTGTPAFPPIPHELFGGWN